ncbi:hypothetical protein [Sinomicrobium weinanense]|uniref:Uncharacterized protein n=1 Tax=Sinomicrobium weinanense TaxID=2842200 RepID=A0A926Q3C7_9FLAO|nr:hypothetical protein [Sinomicrobium weinanense]MBC9796779.1 hypothetical protein [Sinomicrobium weinanense]MBU3125534.1 hypothetical protein [Sinomicrobium weinanense]
MKNVKSFMLSDHFDKKARNSSGSGKTEGQDLAWHYSMLPDRTQIGAS